MNKEKLALKKDQFKSNRGIWSRFYDITCFRCDTFITTYQKDGPGGLKRLYLDRFVDSRYATITPETIDTCAHLVCSNCGDLLGIPYVYERENRPAIRLFAYTVNKKLHKM